MSVIGCVLNGFNMEQLFKKELSSLKQIVTFVDSFSKENSVSEGAVFKLNLMIEEIFTNMIKYAPQSRQDVAIALAQKGNSVIISLIDFGVEPFDVTAFDKVDINQPLEERTPGGLGLHLVKTLADNVSYEYKDGNSKVTIPMSLEDSNV